MKIIDIILSTAFFPPIEYFALIAKADNITIEAFENFQKQTFRNRCQIYSPHGKFDLIVPVMKNSGNKILISQLYSSMDWNWQVLHQRAIESAYNSSPFFLYYKDDLFKYIKKGSLNIFDINLLLIREICKLINLKKEILLTHSYHHAYERGDFRNNISPKNKVSKKYDMIFPQYTQVFMDKHSFISNLSIIDLLFNLGPETKDYLEGIQIISVET